MLQQHLCHMFNASKDRTGVGTRQPCVMSTIQRVPDRPLVLLTHKYLHHHRPATSALHNMTSGTFFNRVIDDGKVLPSLAYLLLCMCCGMHAGWPLQCILCRVQTTRVIAHTTL